MRGRRGEKDTKSGVLFCVCLSIYRALGKRKREASSCSRHITERASHSRADRGRRTTGRADTAHKCMMTEREGAVLIERGGRGEEGERARSRQQRASRPRNKAHGSQEWKMQLTRNPLRKSNLVTAATITPHFHAPTPSDRQLFISIKQIAGRGHADGSPSVGLVRIAAPK